MTKCKTCGHKMLEIYDVYWCDNCGTVNPNIPSNLKNFITPAIIPLVRDLIRMVDEIPCLCHEAYKSRGRRDPDCPKCQWVEEKTVASIKSLLEGKE